MLETLYVYFKCLALLTVTTSCAAHTRLELSGNNWMASEKSRGINIPASVPGSQYTDLLNNHLIEDPLYRDSDVKLAWVGRTNWTYSTDFHVSDHQTNSGKSILTCEGIDTFASIWLNGREIGKTNNMFVPWTYDVSQILIGGANNLTMYFTSAVLVANASATARPYMIPPNCPPDVQHGECHVNQIRKEQCSFSWDWGPSFPTQGIWKPIYIDFYQSAILDEIRAVVLKVDNQWEVRVEAIFNIGQDKATGTLDVSIPGLNASLSKTVIVTPATKKQYVSIVIPKSVSVPVWWPNGYGGQPLFNVTVSFVSSDDTTSKSIRVGFRTIELVQQPVVSPMGVRKDNETNDNADKGLSFYFKINGIPVFLKGSNWIPADNFQERITRERLEYLLSSAADVKINSMRVWGGGVYESEDLYDICDELGILVWQDFMFSVALYPSSADFIQSVSEEVLHQVGRLKHRASILVWAGNNENEKALRQDWFGIKKNYTLYYNDYIKLYVNTIKQIVALEDPTRSYLTSSPSDGDESIKQGYVAKDPGSELYGDIHYYDYAADQWNATIFRIPRMASEYGIQSWCNYESLLHVFEPSDLDINSKMVDHRQHHALGNAQMVAEVGMHLQLPTTTDPQEYFKDFIYLTQINQAMSMRTQTEHYRRYQTKLLADGRGLTMGALYWQLNDIWQAPTWASIDYEGRWKMMHYFARKFFSSHLISPYMRDAGTLDVYLVVDEIDVVETRIDGALHFQPTITTGRWAYNQFPDSDGVTIVPLNLVGVLHIHMYRLDSFKPIYSWAVSYKINSTAESVYTKPIKDLISESSCPGSNHCILYFESRDQTGKFCSSSSLMLSYPKHASLTNAKLQIKDISEVTATEYDITVTSDAPALFVWLSSGDVIGHFSDNGFHILTPTIIVKFYARQATTLNHLHSQLNVRCVRNYQATHAPGSSRIVTKVDVLYNLLFVLAIHLYI